MSSMTAPESPPRTPSPTPATTTSLPSLPASSSLPPPPSPTSPTLLTPEKSEEFEEVTETRIVGITEKGVIRKRSFKRKVRKEDKSKRGFGHNQDEYDAIRRRVIQSKMATESLSNLTQRFKMIEMMHGDCMDLVDDWKVTRERRLRREEGRDMEATLLAVGALVCLVWAVCHWWLF